ncbi:leukocyte elastase inhibitor-like isoform X3 [Varroa destructor]|uniref:Serpin domain-containing protein n=1 Tax=Varroa destructor TaxID=109461 RepID=A0A7M7MG13_VARDE|nr:leukocyte elastase inhibitor-like isoform X3 [Varroa destructor]
MAPTTEENFALGMTLMKVLCAETKENFVFSPLSLGMAFTMLVAGLKGDTKKEVLGFLGCANEDALHKMYSEITKDKNLPLKIANKYLAQHTCKVKENFEKLMREKYESEVEIVNFATDSKTIEGEVNEWVASKTNDMIKQLLSPGTLTADTVLVLLNAIYFKGTWEHEFTPVQYDMEFKLRDGTKVKKEFMTKKSSHFKYLETEQLRMVRIPYKEAGCYMVVAIPKDENRYIDEIMAKMTTAEMAQAVEKLNNARIQQVVLTMPKFKIDYKYVNVVRHIQALGVTKIFNVGEGDFGDLFEEVKDKAGVSDVIHRAVIIVDEKGTEAASATAMQLMLCAMSVAVPPPIIFNLDRPFSFFLSSADHRVSFIGLCAQP